jgi:hypothetical protein
MAPDGTRISALVPMIGAPMPPGDPSRALASVHLASRMRLGASMEPASADDLLGTVKLLREGTE